MSIPDCLFLSHPQSRNSGDYLHRVAWPGDALASHMSVGGIQTTHPQALSLAMQAPLLIIMMIIDPVIERLIKARKRRGMSTVYEISDDFADFPASLPLHDFYSRAENQQMVYRLAGLCDAVQFSSEALAEKYQHCNPVIHVFRNQLPDKSYRLKNRTHSGPLVIGWSGSSGHLEDARFLAETLSGWSGLRQLSIAVMASDNIIQCFKQAGIRVKRYATGSMQAYLKFLRKLDVGVAVLGKSDFNQGRSDGKFLEYASQGVIALCSAHGPYLSTIKDGVNGFLFEDAEQLRAKLTCIVKDASMRQRIRQVAMDEVATTRTHAIASTDRADFYRQWLNVEQGCADYQEFEHADEADLLGALELHAAGQLEAAFEVYLQLLDRQNEFYLLWQRASELCSQTGLAQDAALFADKASTLLDDVLAVTPGVMEE
ncbi:MAG: hypothetical protein V3W04_13020 [Gammaproteobacteria bacterium]